MMAEVNLPFRSTIQSGSCGCDRHLAAVPLSWWLFTQPLCRVASSVARQEAHDLSGTVLEVVAGVRHRRSAPACSSGYQLLGFLQSSSGTDNGIILGLRLVNLTGTLLSFTMTDSHRLRPLIRLTHVKRTG